ncbi:tyramine receptor Ser-2-like [Actinia tenebrosa]|uniref:Tyramine receptor Ser-2-like n=1 Tax=Actinia tenebrosa TaxID=6105 RepID=A0A6P8HN37_ACTTE|nr:tyramine receptor Ser-2-like [Actinia tenebrosa]
MLKNQMALDNQTLANGVLHSSTNRSLVERNNTLHGNMDDSFRVPLSLMSCGVVIGNSLVCALFCKFRKLRTITNSFVVSLAVSDSLVAVLFVPCFLLDGHVPFFALIVPYIIGYILFAYLFNFCGVTYDRYQAIVKPLSYNSRITRSAVNKILTLVWTIPMALTLIPTTWETQPTKIFTLAKRSYQGFLILVVTACSAGILVAYSKIFQETRRQVKWMVAVGVPQIPAAFAEKNSLRGDNSGIKRMNKSRKISMNIAAEVKAAKVFAVLMITFSVCWLPLIVINIIEALGFQKSVPEKLIVVSLYTLVGNSLIDPFIYSLYKTDFRRAFRRWFGCKGAQHSDHEFTSNCSNLFGRDSYRPPKPTQSPIKKGSTLPEPLNQSFSTETFV